MKHEHAGNIATPENLQCPRCDKEMRVVAHLEALKLALNESDYARYSKVELGEPGTEWQCTGCGYQVALPANTTTVKVEHG